jgi:hypothetical protein
MADYWRRPQPSFLPNMSYERQQYYNPLSDTQPGYNPSAESNRIYCHMIIRFKSSAPTPHIAKRHPVIIRGFFPDMLFLSQFRSPQGIYGPK